MQSNGFVTATYAALLFLNFVSLFLSLRNYLSKLKTIFSNNKQWVAFITSGCALGGDVAGIFLCLSQLLLSVRGGSQTIEILLVKLFSLSWGLCTFFTSFNVCVVWIKLAVVGASFGKRGRNALIGIFVSYVLCLALVIVISARTALSMLMILAAIYGLLLTFMFMKGSQLLSVKLSQVYVESNQNSPTNVIKDELKIRPQKGKIISHQKVSFFHIKSQTSCSVIVQPKLAEIKHSAPIYSEEFDLPSVIESAISNCAVVDITEGKNEIDAEQRLQTKTSLHLKKEIPVDRSNRQPIEPAKVSEGNSTFEKNLRQIQRVRKCSKVLMVLHLLYSLGSAMLAATITNTQLGALPCTLILFTFLCNVLVRVTIVEYLYGSNRSVTRFLSTF